MKILYVNYVMNQGGIENFIMSTSRDIVKDNDISYLTIIHSDDKFYYEDEINAMGCKIFKLDKDKTGTIKFVKNMVKLFKKEKFDVVHSNIYVASGYVMLAAWLAGVKVRLTHSHSSYEPNGLKQKINYKIAKLLVHLFSTKRIACSKKAGKSLFGRKKFDIIENGIKIDKFKFNETVRDEVRNQYNIKSNDIVMGHIGRLVEVKNHKFLIELFNECLKNNSNMKLLLVGDGEERINLEKLVKQLGIEEKVIFVGSVSDTSKYYNAMDIFVLPSFFEGLPYVLVEAQVNGLNIVASDTVSRDSNLIDNVTFISLNSSKDEWMRVISEKSKNRHFDDSFFETSYFNIDNMIKKVLLLYNRK